MLKSYITRKCILSLILVIISNRFEIDLGRIEYTAHAIGGSLYVIGLQSGAKLNVSKEEFDKVNAELHRESLLEKVLSELRIGG